MMTVRSVIRLTIVISLLGCLLITLGCRREKAASTEPVALKSTYITPDFNTVILVQVDRILSSPLVAQLKANTGDQYFQEILEQLNLKYKISLQDARKFTMIATSIADTASYHADIANIVHYKKDMDVGQVNKQMIGENSKVMFGQHTYFRSLQSDYRSSAYWLDQRTVIAASERHLKQIIPGTSVNRPLVELVEKAESTSDAVLAFTIQSMRPETILNLKAIPPSSPYHPFIPALDHLKSVVLSIDLTDKHLLRVNLEGHDGTSAAALAELSTSALNHFKQLLDSRIGQVQQAVEHANLLTIFKIARESLDRVALKMEGNFVVLTTTLSTETFSQLVKATSDDVLRSAQRRYPILVRSRLDQIGAGIFQFHQAHGRLPVGDRLPVQYRDGKPLLSWRVHLLPFLQEEKLYQEFHLDEPWDSEHNLKLVEQIPHVYTSPQHGELKGHTTYLAPSGKGTVFGERKVIGFDDISDGLRQTILVVQVGPDQAVMWTKPEDLVFRGEDSLEQLGQIGDQLSVLFADGRVFHINPRIDPRTLQTLFQYQDGGRVDRRQLRR